MEIYRDKGPTSRSISIEITAEGDVKMEGYDIGEAPETFYGDSDYEFWVIVKRAHKDKLRRALGERKRGLLTRLLAKASANAALLALIARDFGGKPSAVDDFRAFLDAHAIPYEPGSYM